MLCLFSSKTVQRIWEDTINFVLWLNTGVWLMVICHKGYFIYIFLYKVYLLVLSILWACINTVVCIKLQLSIAKLNSWRACWAQDNINQMPVELVPLLDLFVKLLYLYSWAFGCWAYFKIHPHIIHIQVVRKHHIELETFLWKDLQNRSVKGWEKQGGCSNLSLFLLVKLC